MWSEGVRKSTKRGRRKEEEEKRKVCGSNSGRCRGRRVDGEEGLGKRTKKGSGGGALIDGETGRQCLWKYLTAEK